MIELHVNGETYPLRYSFRALKKFEQKTKVSVFSLGENNNLSADSVGWLIYCGIVDGCKFEGIEFSKSLAEIEEHLDLSHVETAMEALQQYAGGKDQKKAKATR